MGIPLRVFSLFEVRTTNTMTYLVAFLKILLELALLVCFLYFFGVPSFLRYQEGKDMVVVKKTDTDGIPAPAVTICARNEKDKKHVSDACNGADNAFSCMETESWAGMKDVVLDAGKGYLPTIETLMGAEFWDLQIRLRFECFTFSMNERIGPLYHKDALNFIINNTTRIYEFYIHSLDFFIPNRNPIFMPVNRFKMFPKTDCRSFLSISMIEKHELNTVADPCENSKEYNFTRCIEQSIASQAGCDGKEACESGEQYRSIYFH